MVEWPDWWGWEVDTSLSHLLKRMLDRDFSDTDLRTMLEDATGYHKDHEPDRYVIETRHGGKAWHIIVEPLVQDELLMVVTAYKPD